MTKEEVYKSYPDQDPTFLQRKIQLPVEMAFFRRINITLTPQDPRKVHPNYGNRYTTFELYSLSLKFWNIRDDILGITEGEAQRHR